MGGSSVFNFVSRIQYGRKLKAPYKRGVKRMISGSKPGALPSVLPSLMAT